MSGMPDILLEIVARRRERLADQASELVNDGRPKPPSIPPARPGAGRTFLDALSAPGPSIIAEIKLGSPRLGDLRAEIDPERQAARYAAGGARALSVVVEPDYFYGSYDLLKRCKVSSGLPTLAKDFVVDSRQLEWAALAGADAVLLIAALYSPQQLRHYAASARQMGIVPLVETHDDSDLAKLEGHAWEMVGINNRDLRTFDVDLGRSIELLDRIPGSAVRVAESGLKTAADVERLAEAGFDAFLVGEALLQAEDVDARLAELAGAGDRST